MLWRGRYPERYPQNPWYPGARHWYPRQNAKKRPRARISRRGHGHTDGNGMSEHDVTPALVIRTSKDGTPYWEAKWRLNGRQIKRRVPGGPAWAEQGPDGSWRPKAGRARTGTLSRDRAAVLAVGLVTEVAKQARAERELGAQASRAPMTFRRVSAEWLGWVARVKGAKPSTLEDYGFLLREPGHPFKRGNRVSEGRIMKAFGARDLREVTAREVEAFLSSLEDAGLKPRNVNKHRQVLCAVWEYACRADTYALPVNVAAQTDKRREPLPAALDFYEPHEVELLASVLASGEWRTDRPDLSIEERQARAAEDARDADLFRLLLFTGLRLGEARALRWGAVNLDDRTLMVRAALSAGVEVDPKGRAYRVTPLTSGAVQALERHRARSGDDFTSPADLVFCGRFGEPLDDSALRRRYKLAREKAGLREVKLHGLRHAAGSIFARQATAVEVRDFLGHRNLSTTDRYVSARMNPEALARLDEAFAPRSTSSTDAAPRTQS